MLLLRSLSTVDRGTVDASREWPSSIVVTFDSISSDPAKAVEV